MADEPNVNQSMSSSDNSLLIQAGRDVILPMRKTPPSIRLVRITIEEERDVGLRQKINVVLKNNGDTTAVLLRGQLITDGQAFVHDCNHLHARYSLLRADWQYDVNLDDEEPTFTGTHAIAPNEVVSFDVMVGRRNGQELTVYRSRLRLTFDEGNVLETERFHLKLIGPMTWAAASIPQGPTAEEWGRCMADNIRRLDKIGYDLRPDIDPGSVQHVEAVEPDLMSQPPT